MVKPVVLVHGAFHGAWCWEKVTPLLDDAGVPWHALDLPSCADAASGAGVAEDDDSIIKVEVSVQDIDQDLYWAGGKWSPSRVWIEAKLANPQGLISDWQMWVDLTKIENGGSIQITARSQNAEEKFSQSVVGLYRVDSIEPTTEIRIPQNASVVESPFIVFGICGDNAEMRGVELELKDLGLNRFWDGATWTKEKVTFFNAIQHLFFSKY